MANVRLHNCAVEYLTFTYMRRNKYLTTTPLTGAETWETCCWRTGQTSDKTTGFIDEKHNNNNNNNSLKYAPVYFVHEWGGESHIHLYFVYYCFAYFTSCIIFSKTETSFSCIRPPVYVTLQGILLLMSRSPKGHCCGESPVCSIRDCVLRNVIQ